LGTTLGHARSLSSPQRKRPVAVDGTGASVVANEVATTAVPATRAGTTVANEKHSRALGAANLATTAGRLDPGGIWELDEAQALAAAKTLIEQSFRVNREADPQEPSASTARR